jgi:hypothetical protein
MRLVDLDPRFYVLEEGGPRVGLTFECPHCVMREQASGDKRVCRLGVAFHHAGHEAIDDDYIRARSPSTGHIWTESGDDFDALSLTPSVDASAGGHWHGFVTKGEVK